MIPRLIQPTKRAKEWHKKNPWFGVDMPLTEAAICIHEALVLSKIKVDSLAYYKAMDALIELIKPFFRTTRK